MLESHVRLQALSLWQPIQNAARRARCRSYAILRWCTDGAKLELMMGRMLEIRPDQQTSGTLVESSDFHAIADARRRQLLHNAPMQRSKPNTQVNLSRCSLVFRLRPMRLICRCVRHHIPHLCRDRLRKREVEPAGEAPKIPKGSPMALGASTCSSSQLTSFVPGSHPSFRPAVNGGSFPSQRKNLLIPRPPPSAAFLQTVLPSRDPTRFLGPSPIQSVWHLGQGSVHFHPSHEQQLAQYGSMMGNSVARRAGPMAISSDGSAAAQSAGGFQTHSTPLRSAQSSSPVNHKAAVGPYASFRYCSPLGSGLTMDSTRRLNTGLPPPSTAQQFLSPRIVQYSVSGGSTTVSSMPHRACGAQQPSAVHAPARRGHLRHFDDQANQLRLNGTDNDKGPGTRQSSTEQLPDNASTSAIASGGPHSPLNPRLLISGSNESQDGPLPRYNAPSTDSTLYHDTAPEYSSPTTFENLANGWNFSEPENSASTARLSQADQHSSDFANRSAPLPTLKSEAVPNTNGLERRSPPLAFLGAEHPESCAATDQQPGYPPPLSCGSPSAPARAEFSGPITASLFTASNQDTLTAHHDAFNAVNSLHGTATAGSDDWAHGEDMLGVFDLLLDQDI